MGFLFVVVPRALAEDPSALAITGVAGRSDKVRQYRSGLLVGGEPALLLAVTPRRDWSRNDCWPLHWVGTHGDLAQHPLTPWFEALSRAAGEAPIAVVEHDHVLDMATLATWRAGALEAFLSESDTPLGITAAPPLVPPLRKRPAEARITLAGVEWDVGLKARWKALRVDALAAVAEWQREGVKPKSCPCLASLLSELFVTDGDFDAPVKSKRPSKPMKRL